METQKTVTITSLWGSVHARVLGYRVLHTELIGDLVAFTFEADAAEAIAAFSAGTAQCDLNLAVQAHRELIKEIKRLRGEPV